MDRPNILYIHSHDTGRLIQPYGHAVPTPALQRLAEQGVLFRQAFCAGPTCSPSRAALLTGSSPHSCGMLGLAHRGFALHEARQHLAWTLKSAGYRTALSGVQHLAPRDEEGLAALGYDEYLGHQREAERHAVKFLEAEPAEPFFLSVGFFETHRPFPPADFDADPRHTAPPATMPDSPAVREDMARFVSWAGRLDRKMGSVFEALDRTGLAERTLVVCTTDHGASFPRMKCHLTDAGIGVMLMMRGPGGFDGGKVIDGMVSHIDIFPTICELLGIDRPAWLEGVSVLPLVNGEAETVREEVFSEATYHAAYEPMRCARTERYKYIRRWDGRDRPVLPNTDFGGSKDYWLGHGFADQPPEAEALYDLVFDPHEQNNLLDRPEMKDVLADMRARLERWMTETNDPLLAGEVPPPPGSQFNDPDGLHASDPPLEA